MTKNRIWVAITIFILLVSVILSPCLAVSNSEGYLIAAGTTLGVRFGTDGVLITGICETNDGENEVSAAFEAGLRRGDIITGINGSEIKESTALCRAINEMGGEEMELKFLRGGKEQSIKVCAKRDKDGSYKLGLWVRDSASGIGTVTFINPSDKTFAGLGHGICNPDNGALLPMRKGEVEEVMLTGVNCGKNGAPGELRGFFTGRKGGELFKNSESGVFGRLDEIPQELENELYETGKKESVHEGEAYIISTVDENGRRKYTVEISKIDNSGNQKNFTIKVTDAELIEKTGGIVRGMSGSPIIQDGKLIGAVTHVMISDPTMGYGIFIENMLS